MSSIKKAFFAYSANPESLAETIENGIKEINSATMSYLQINGWKSLSVAGNVIITEICEAIDNADLFLCDLTVLNMNVLFELGYAIARDKHIWITLDSTDTEALKIYKRLSPLSSIGYIQYENSFDLKHKFLDHQDSIGSKKTLLDRFQGITEGEEPNVHLLYLKCGISSEASIKLTQFVRQQQVIALIDDPEEVRGQTLEWYIKGAITAFGVIVHLIDERRVRATEENLIQNSIYALVAGLAHGFEIPTLILAHEPFTPPVDFRELLFVHSTAESCIRTAKEWLGTNSEPAKFELEQSKSQKRLSKEVIRLRNINLGQYIAENEHKELSDYFVTTAPYNEALKTTQYLIYVGRKGTGKTANLFQIQEQLESDKRNFVCTLKPVDYELEGVLTLLGSNISKTNPGYLLESLWKYLIYTELATSLYEYLGHRPDLTKAEIELQEYVDKYKHFIRSEFTERIEYAIRELCEIDVSSSVVEQRINVSEILHHEIIATLRTMIGNVLQKKQKVVVLVDNLDKAWYPRKDLSMLSDFLFGLLSAGQRITSEFQKAGEVWKPVNLVLIVFLRSDIFSHIVTQARESDKVVHKTMDWNDPILLQRIIEERFLASINNSSKGASDIWVEYFVPEIGGISTNKYITDHILPRPRDIIFFCQSALDHAINHRNTRIEEADIYQASINYSKHVYESFLSETKAIQERIENLLVEFAGVHEIVTEEEVRMCMEKAKIPLEQMKMTLELLCAHTFLGLETKQNQFEFLYESSRADVIRKLASDMETKSGKRRYKINTPFHPYLEISK